MVVQLNAPILDTPTRSAIERYVRSLPTFTTTDKGYVPTSPGGTAKYLRADGTWVVPPAGGAASPYTVVTKTAGYTETTTSGELIIKADLAAGFTIVLPTAVGNTATISIVKIQAAGQITVDGAGAETIVGGLTAVLNNAFESITIKSDNANWVIV